MSDDNVPPGLTAKQDEIIQYVAKYVVASCDGARYQEKLRTRTKYNSYFAFLDAKHPFHAYYQYLLDSYRHWMLNSAAVGGGGGWGADGTPSQQQQLTEEEYYQYYGAYQTEAGAIGFQTGEATESHASPQGSDAVPSGAVDPTAAPETSPSEEVATTLGAAEQPAEEEEDAYELVMENGEWVSRKVS